MPTFGAERRFHNPGKRRMTLKQKLHFGTAKQRAVAKAAMSGRRKPKKAKARAKARPAASKHRKATTPRYITHRKRTKRQPNPSKIAVLTRLINAGILKGGHKVAKSRKRRPYYSHRAKSRPKVRVRTRTVTKIRYRNAKKRFKNSGRRRRTGMMGGIAGSAIRLLGGGAICMFVDKMFPTTGVMSYVVTAIVALAQYRFLGKAWGIGGGMYLAVKGLASTSFGQYLPYQLRGLGLLAPSSFYTPQVNRNGSMSRFVRPAAVALPAAVPTAAAMRGVNAPSPFGITQRRMGRMS